MGVALTGTPVTGYISLTSASLGPSPFVLTTVRGQAPYSLQTNERIYLTAITASTNDVVTGGLVTVDDGGVGGGIAQVTKLASFYTSLAQQLLSTSFFAGYTFGCRGVVPRASVSGLQAAKTVEVMIYGYISKT